MRDDGKYKNIITMKMYLKAMETWLMKYAERKQNMIVVVPSTPAQYFHVLRRQIHRSYAKPLVVMSAKWLLHHKLCVSELSDFYEGTYFHRVIVEGGIGDNMKRRSSSSPSSSQASSLVEAKHIKRIIFCCGKIFYHLYHEREIMKIDNIIIIRIEQLAPFPYDLIISILQQYRHADDVVWCQEEPKNMGAYSYVKPRLETAMRDIIDTESTNIDMMYNSRDGDGHSVTDTSDGMINDSSIQSNNMHNNMNNNISNEQDRYQFKAIQYIGRSPLAASASGGMKEHIDDQKKIIMNALRI